ncbi:MAG: leucine-rich repeat protein [Eubacteriales bacterium]|nr:leucine-rich repeat protein [Eubacteriales bacterium]
MKKMGNYVKRIFWMLFLVAAVWVQPGTSAEAATTVREGMISSYGADNGRKLAVRLDGSLWAWGDYEYTYNDTLYSDVPTKIMEGVKYVCADSFDCGVIKEDGSLWMWGANPNGELLDGTTTKRSSTSPIKVMENVKAISMRYGAVAVIKEDGSLWTWGKNSSGRLGNGTYDSTCVPTKIMEGVKYVYMDSNYGLALKENGELWGWGSSKAPLGDVNVEMHATPIKILSQVESVCPSENLNIVYAVKTDGTIWKWASSYSYSKRAYVQSAPTQVDNPLNGKRIKKMWACTNNSIRGLYSVVLTADGELWRSFYHASYESKGYEKVADNVFDFDMASNAGNGLAIKENGAIYQDGIYGVGLKLPSVMAEDLWGATNPPDTVEKEYYDKIFGKAYAKLLWSSNKNSKGLCYGMVLSGLSSLIYQAPEKGSFGVEFLSEIKSQNITRTQSTTLGMSVWELWKYGQAYQHTFSATKESTKNKNDLEGLLDALADYGHTGAPVMVKMINDEKEGHEIFAVGLKDYNQKEHQKTVRIYDPNYPGEEKTLILNYDISKGKYASWSYGDTYSSDKYDITYETQTAEKFKELIEEWIEDGPLGNVVSEENCRLLNILSSSNTTDIDALVTKNLGSYASPLSTSNGTGTSSNTFQYWIEGTKDIVLKDVPKGTEISVASPYHAVTVTVQSTSDLTFNVQDSGVSTLQVTSDKAASFEAACYNASENSDQVEVAVITGTTTAGKPAKITRSDSDIQITGTTKLSVEQKKGTENSNGELDNPKTQTIAATDIDSTKTYQIPTKNATLQVKTSSKNNGVFDETVDTSTSTLKVKGTYTSGSLKYKVTKLSGSTGTATVVAPKSKTATSVTIPATVKISGVTLKVTAIGDNAFKGMTKLKKVTIGKNVTKIGKTAFSQDKKLTKITVKGTALKSIGKNALKGISSSAAIVVPKSKLSAYKKLLTASTGFTSKMKVQDTSGTKIWTVTFKNGSKTVKTQYVTNGKAAKAPSLTKKGYVLSWSASFKKVTKNLTVKAVWTPELPKKGYTATVSGLKYKVTKSDSKNGTVQVTGVTSKSLAKYTVPERVKIGKTTFRVTSIGANAFKDCKKAKNFVLPKTITSIGAKAFSGTAANTTVTVPKAQYAKLSKLLRAAGLDKKASIKKK